VIYRHIINSLSEEELDVLMFLLVSLSKSQIKVDIEFLPFYKLGFIHHILKIGGENIKDEHRELYKGLCLKFELEI
tara:strand:- start:367 stop:594 length:228 start_codon:yes stop_codon:yes gene_type:complete